MNRRDLLSGLASVGAVSTLPFPAQADGICRICKLSKLHPARFLAGIAFDVVRAIIVQEASDLVVESLVSQKANKLAPTTDESNPRPFNEYYKGALIVAGEVNYEVTERARLRAILKPQEIRSEDRIKLIKQYLASRGIFLKSAYTSISYPVDENTTLDDLLSIEYFEPQVVEMTDLEILLELASLSGSTAIKDWVGL